MTNVLKTNREIQEAAISRFFIDLEITPTALEIAENFEAITADSTHAREILRTYTKEDLDAYDVVIKRGKLPEDETEKQRIIAIDRLVETGHMLSDAASVIEKEGSRYADELAKSRDGTLLIGEHFYWVQEADNRFYLCAQNIGQDEVVFFNRSRQFNEYEGRCSGLQDYLALIRDVSSAQIQASTS